MILLWLGIRRSGPWTRKMALSVADKLLWLLRTNCNRHSSELVGTRFIGKKEQLHFFLLSPRSIRFHSLWTYLPKYFKSSYHCESTWQVQGLFHPDSCPLSAGERDADLRGEAPIGPLSSFVCRYLRPITGVCDKSNVNSIVLPGSSWKWRHIITFLVGSIHLTFFSFYVLAAIFEFYSRAYEYLSYFT